MNGYVSLGTSIVIGIAGQLCLKEGALRPSSVDWAPVNPFVVLGLGAYFVAALFYISAIRSIPLSVAFPSVSISYVVVALFAHWLWGEAFGWWQLAGLGCISTGIYLLHFS